MLFVHDSTNRLDLTYLSIWTWNGEITYAAIILVFILPVNLDRNQIICREYVGNMQGIK